MIPFSSGIRLKNKRVILFGDAKHEYQTILLVKI